MWLGGGVWSGGCGPGGGVVWGDYPPKFFFDFDF